MNCAQIKEHLVDFLYDEMPADARTAFLEHIRGCPVCGRELASHQRTLGHARMALAGQLAQEPPARVHLAVMEAAAQAATKAATKAAPQAVQLRRSHAREELGFFARLLRTPWLLPAFGAAGIATAVFLVRVLKNPEVIPGQEPRVVDERALAPSAAPAAPTMAERQASDIPGSATVAPMKNEPKALDKMKLAKSVRDQGEIGGNVPAIAEKKTIAKDPVTGVGKTAPAAAVGRKVATEGWGASARAGRPAAKSLGLHEEVTNEAAPSRYAEPPPRSVPQPLAKVLPAHEVDDFDEDLSLDQTPAPKVAARPSPASAAPSEARYAAPPPSSAGSFAAPAPAQAPVYAEEEARVPAAQPRPHRNEQPTPPPPTPSKKKEARATAGAGESFADAEIAAADKGAARERKDTSSLDESVRRADRLFADGDWSAAAAAYQDLLRRFPSAKDAPKWRERMNSATVAAREGRKPSSTKAAKAKGVVNDPLNGLDKL